MINHWHTSLFPTCSSTCLPLQTENTNVNRQHPGEPTGGKKEEHDDKKPGRTRKDKESNS